MVGFQELCALQSETVDRIERAWSVLIDDRREKPSVAEFEQRLSLIQSYWNKFLENHREIIVLPDYRGSDYARTKLYDQVEDLFVDTSAKISNVIKRAKSKIETSTVQAGANNPTHLPLPKIELPRFSGDPLQWEAFRDLFNSLVGNVASIPNVNKLLYLRACLTDEAAEVISKTQITDDGFVGAWQDLEARYANARIISAKYVRAMFNCKPAKKSSSSELKHLLDTFRQLRRAFESLGKPVREWDEIFVYALTDKLDRLTRILWESSLSDSKQVPLFKTLDAFLENRIHALEAVDESACEFNNRDHSSKETNKPRNANRTRGNDTNSSFATATSPKKREPRRCPLCTGPHNLSYCVKFKGLDCAQRLDQTHRLKACENCLHSNHTSSNCQSQGRCFRCQNKHHTLLHDSFNTAFKAVLDPSQNKNTSVDKPIYLNKAETSTASKSSSDNISVSLATHSSLTRKIILMPTAQIGFRGPHGNTIKARVMFDDCSDSTYVSEWIAQALNLRKTSVNVSVTGLQATQVGVVKSMVDLDLFSFCDNAFNLKCKAYVLNKLTSLIPKSTVNYNDWQHLQGLNLADPDFLKPAPIDAILGGDVCARLILDESRHGSQGTPSAKLTPFGWIVMGPAMQIENSHTTSQTFHIQAHPDVDINLERFWELEEAPSAKRFLTKEESVCAQHFAETHSRDLTGRYVVRLPFKHEGEQRLGYSKAIATRLFLNQEARMKRDPIFQKKYCEFMLEYRQLGHMVETTTTHESSNHFLPHHGVLKTHDSGGKIRVVFNAASKSTSGVSLNDVLLTGPKLQPDLWVILCRWRSFRIALSADIVKMYRQIRVHDDDLKYQNILWRTAATDELLTYTLQTVVYGTNCAPYLALATLLQLAKEGDEQFPIASRIIRENSYVDDFFFGGDNLQEARERRDQLIQLLDTARFPLSKWSSNHPRLCPTINMKEKEIAELDTVSTLGLIWDPVNDQLALKVADLPPITSKVTKRQITSEVATLFDPLGFIAPVIISAKILIQDLWLSKVQWDEPLNETLTKSWIDFRATLNSLQSLRIPRWTGISARNAHKLQIHGFCDASERAYAACIYFRICTNDDQIISSLVIAKTKVAPTKRLLTIPRLELCSALLLAKLLHHLTTRLDLNNTPIFAWTDSKDSLAWLQTHPSKWKPFIANRTSEIQNLIPRATWAHVKGAENPADLGTRGISPRQLLCADIWWQGPTWLSKPDETWIPTSQQQPDGTEFVELRTRKPNAVEITACHTNTAEQFDDLLTRYSSVSKLISILAWCYRWQTIRRNSEDQRLNFITSDERSRALTAACRISQRHSFQAEIQALSKNSTVAANSTLASLKPFLDSNGLIRVGGRLPASPLSYDERHPIVLSKRCPFTKLLIKDAHVKTLHGGAQSSRNLLMSKYWIPQGRSTINSVIRECIQCTRQRGKIATQLMGNLPLDRVKPQRAFLTTGVDYAGPILIKSMRGRKYTTYKGYICLFVCTVTKALHLEFVTDLSSNAFIAAFKRFVSRRGRCAKLLSDNGTTFHGADKELRRQFKSATTFHREVAAELSLDGTEWSFIPPYSPHFGGLWEAGVKSVKFHMRRVIGDSLLNYEQMSTLLCQIEACLNSRPLSSLSNDPNDLLPLTPAHFLIGENLIAVPEPPVESLNINLLNNYKLINHLRNSFWSRWSKEYLHQLQPVSKWQKSHGNLQVGTLVLIRGETSPPTKWPLARVVAVHPGDDGLVRVVDLRTSKGITSRAITKICPLPITPIAM